MKKFWLILGFDSLSATSFVPDPALFRTEKEAIGWCKEHSINGLLFGSQLVQVGSFKKEKA